MLRISGGNKKNIQLQVAKESRPLTERLRMSVFQIINDFVPGARVLDLYAGSGVSGLEALSRGASSCTFVDSSRFAAEIIQKNIEKCKFGQEIQTQVICTTSNQFLKKLNPDIKFDLVFMDPPFDRYALLDLDNTEKILQEDGLVAIRLPSRAERFDIKIKSKLMSEVYSQDYGKSRMVFYKKQNVVK